MEKFSVFERLRSQTLEVMCSLPDHRQPSNATKYGMEAAGMGALSVFMMQDPSFLRHQERLSSIASNHNFNTLFGCEHIPTPNQIRNMLDDVSPDHFHDLYDQGLDVLNSGGGLSPFKVLGDSYLIALDGTQYHHSSSVHCPNCTVKKRGDKVMYSHSMVCAAIVSPNVKAAIPLVPEFIVPQDGHSKQDCENAAIKRWLNKNSNRYKSLNPTILGDDLLSRQPICEALLKEGFHFILVCKADSHKTLYTFLDGIKLNSKTMTMTKRNQKRVLSYRSMNALPIKDGDDALSVNWIEIQEKDKKTGKLIYTNTFITDHHITTENCRDIADTGRARWKIENENNNTLKTKGYRFEHNYGHGKKHLSSVFATLSLVAFLYHTVMDLIDELYIKAKASQGTKINFFNMARAFTCSLLFTSWDSLMTFILEPPDPHSLGVF